MNNKAMLHAMQKELRKKFSKQMCMVPECMKSECNKKSPRCHTISKKASLEKIAVGGHVYSIAPYNDVDFYKRLGVNQATIFYGFCKKHDNSIFEPIENVNDVISTRKQFTLLAYRSICFRLYYKYSSRQLNNNSQLSELLPPEYLQLNSDGIDIAIKDLEYYKKIYDSIIFEKKSQRITTVLIRLFNVPLVMGTGFVVPDIDLEGNVVNDLKDPHVIAKGFTINCVGEPCNDSGLITMSATDNSRELLLAFYNQLKNKSPSEIFEIIVKWLFLWEENIIFNITWWDGLDVHIKDKFREMFTLNMTPLPYNADQPRVKEFINHNFGFFHDIKIDDFKLVK